MTVSRYLAPRSCHKSLIWMWSKITRKYSTTVSGRLAPRKAPRPRFEMRYATRFCYRFTRCFCRCFCAGFELFFARIFVPRFWGVAWFCIDLDVDRGDMAIVYKNGINVSPPTIMTHVKHFGTIDTLCKHTCSRRGAIRRQDLEQAKKRDRGLHWEIVS
jgi:hypothetical protein